MVNERKRAKGVSKTKDISRLDRCMENTDKVRNFADKGIALLKHNFHFKIILRMKMGGRSFKN